MYNKNQHGSTPYHAPRPQHSTRKPEYFAPTLRPHIASRKTYHRTPLPSRPAEPKATPRPIYTADYKPDLREYRTDGYGHRYSGPDLSELDSCKY